MQARSLAVFAALLAVAAFFSPVWAGEPESAAGVLLLFGAVAESLNAFAARGALSGTGVTLLLALLLLNAPWFATTAIALFVAVPFALEAVRDIGVALRRARNGESPWHAMVFALGNLAATAGILLVGRFIPPWVVATAAAVRLAQVALKLLVGANAPIVGAGETVVADIGLDHPAVAESGARLHAEERSRSAVDRGWVISLLAVLLTVHVSRMGFDRSTLGMLSPVVALLGDVAVALMLTYFLIVPMRLFVRWTTRGIERRAWLWVLAAEPPAGVAGWPRRVMRWRLESRMRFSIRMRSARGSLASALSRGLQIGLPLSAVIVASVPILGMSWYFNTESWAAGIWNSWAASRTDTWREAMVQAVVSSGRTTTGADGFSIAPPGVNGTDPFSFVVIGDTGEGDASQHVLRDQLLRAAALDDVRFVVISSDVVYPTGAMRDYEPRFWLPFKGVTKPVYAIPGNHDWYDALEGFTATFFEPASARAAMRARIEVDRRLSGTTDETIEKYIEQASFFRGQYAVPTGYQQGPFFQIRTPGFTLLAVDTGVLRRVDPEQLRWLRAALEAARGTTIMVIMGHPLFAGGHDVARGDDDFTEIRDLLREHDVRIVMAGDTHDLEYYREPAAGPNGPGAVHHWTNGGGGAYLSFGTSLAWPPVPDTAVWAYYPGKHAVVEKIRAFTPWWKWPVWVWTREFGAWPASAEWLSAMFDYNVAPFFQSFVVVTVDPKDGRVSIRPWGIHGPLTWNQLDRSPGIVPAGVSPDQAVEWVIR